VRLTEAGVRNRFCNTAAVIRPDDFAGPDDVLPLTTIGYKTTTVNGGVVGDADAMRNAETICPERFYTMANDASALRPADEGARVKTAVASWAADGILRLDVQLPYHNRRAGQRLQLVGPGETHAASSTANPRDRRPHTERARTDIKVVVDVENMHHLFGPTIAKAVRGNYTGQQAAAVKTTRAATKTPAVKTTRAAKKTTPKTAGSTTGKHHAASKATRAAKRR